MKKEFAFIIVFALVLAGCDLLAPQTQDISTAQPQQAPVPGDNSSIRLTQDNLVLTVKTDKKEYLPGETVKISAELENKGKNSISYSRPTPCSPDISIYLDLKGYGKTDLFEKSGSASQCIQQIDYRTLPPMQAINRQVEWSQELPTQPQKLAAQPGKYLIYTTFEYALQGNLKDISVIYEINITGQQKAQIAKEDALRIAYSNQDVVKWYDTHLGTAVVAEEFGEYFLLGKYGRDRIDNSTAQMIIASKPEEQVLFLNGNWIISFESKYGDEPREIELVIDGKEGIVTSIRYPES